MVLVVLVITGFIWIAKDEAAYEDPNNTVTLIPTELVPTVRALLAQYETDNPAEPAAT